MVSSWLLSIISFKFLAREPLMQMFIDFKRLNDNFARNQLNCLSNLLFFNSVDQTMHRFEPSNADCFIFDCSAENHYLIVLVA